jgi:putative glutathione S-transferase
MGFLENGVWNAERLPDDSPVRQKPSIFHDFVSNTNRSRFRAEPERYHLFVSLACPWACRTIMTRKLKKLEYTIGMSVVEPEMMECGWTFGGKKEPLTGLRFLYELYTRASASYSGLVTVPCLWDNRLQTIVNNESSEIIRMLNREFDEWADQTIDLYPSIHANEIDNLNLRVYTQLNSGVYRAGFATTQDSYERAVRGVFEMLDELELRLEKRRYLLGNKLTEADIRLFTTLVRFDLIYYPHFKCNMMQLRDFANLSGWLRDVYQIPGIADTVDVMQIKRHYYLSQRWLNPSGIIPVGPSLDLTSPHGRKNK